MCVCVCVYPKVPEIWILHANGYEYIEILRGVFPAEWLGLLLVNSIVMFPW
jgi:hypothetical protein